MQHKQLRQPLVVAIIMFVIVLSLGSIKAQDELELCNTEYAYLLVEPAPIQAFDEEGQEIESSQPGIKPYVIMLQSDDPIGLILSNNSVVTMYSSVPKVAQVYAMRPDASANNYRYVNPDTVLVATTQFEQNIFNDAFEEISRTEPYIACDSQRLLATRPISVMGGSSLQNLETQQRALSTSNQQPEETRRSELANNLFTHEMVVISSEPITERPTPRAAASIHFETLEPLAFQVVQLGDASIDLAVPTIATTSEYFLVADREVNIEVYVRVNGELLKKDTDGTSPRNDFLTVTQQNPDTFFSLLRNDAFFVYPNQVTTQDYGPDQILRLEFAELTDAEVGLRSFNCGRVRVIDRTSKRESASDPITYRDNKFFATVLTAAKVDETIIVSGVDDQGRLVVTLNGNELVTQHWLLECPELGG
jgi:hypothetical protein